MVTHGQKGPFCRHLVRQTDLIDSRYDNPNLSSLPALVSYNASKRPHDIAFLHPVGESFTKTSWKDFDCIVGSLAASYSQAFEQQIIDGMRHSRQPTVALLGSGHTFDYFATQLALLKLGLRVILLSPGNAIVARDHLLQTCDAVGLVVQSNLLANSGDVEMPVVIMLAAPTPLTSNERNTAFPRFEPVDVWNSHSLIIHSSGTTGLPKPIIHTHRSLMLIARMYRLFPDFAINNWYLAFPL